MEVASEKVVASSTDAHTKELHSDLKKASSHPDILVRESSKRLRAHGWYGTNSTGTAFAVPELQTTRWYFTAEHRAVKL